MNPSPPVSPSENNLSQAFKFIQLNMWTGRLYYPLHAFLEREKPDIFSAQEVYSGPGDSKPDHMTLEMLLSEEHGFFNDFAKGGGGKTYTTYRLQERVQHCVTLTRQPVARIESHDLLPVRNATETVFNDKGVDKDYHSLLHSTVRLEDGTVVNILNYHGRVVFGGRMGSPVNDADILLIAEYISKLSGPTVFSGDFNMYRGASSLQPLNDLGLKNLNDVYDITAARNEFSWKPEEVVSHVFVNDSVIVEDYRVATDNVSDHLPLIMLARIRK